MPATRGRALLRRRDDGRLRAARARRAGRGDLRGRPAVSGGGGRRCLEAADQPAILVGDASAITLIDGLTFAISDALGDIEGGSSGLIADDTRHLSRLRLSVDDDPVRALGAAQLSPSTARFRGFAVPEAGRADPSLEIERRRRVGADGLEDEVILRWWAGAPRRVSVGIDLDADFSDIFAIRGMDTGSAAQRDSVRAETTADGIRFHDPETGLETNVRFDPVPEALVGGGARWAPELRRGEPWRVTTTVEVGNAAGGRPRASGGGPRSAVAVVTDPPDLGRGCRRALGDLAALSMPDRLAPGRRLVAAGIPWFVALFGRDSLIAGHQARAFLPGQVMDTLAALADRQGRVSDRGNEEEPGKILHEVRLTPRAWLGEGTVSGARPYYGTIDATPLFLILYGTALRWGASRPQLEELLPAARAAAGWMRGPGDPDGDGLLEYAPDGPAVAEQPGMEGLGGRGPVRRRPPGRGPDRDGRGAGLRLPRPARAGRGAPSSGTRPGGGRARGRGRRPARADPRALLDRGRGRAAGPLRARARRRQAAGGRGRLQHGAPVVVRRALPRGGRAGRPSPGRSRHGQRLGAPHPVAADAGVQPDLLPRRVGAGRTTPRSPARGCAATASTRRPSRSPTT